MSKYLPLFIFVCVAVFGGSLSANAQTATTTDSVATTTVATTTVPTSTPAVTEEVFSLLKIIKDLQDKLATLTKQKSEVRQEMSEVRTELKTLREGMTDEDVRKIQELLATDPSIYPEGLKTGYFGALTKKALMRLQERHKLAATGEMNEETRALLESYLKERMNGTVPPGLLRAPGIMKKVEDRIITGEEIRIDCTSLTAAGPLCKAKIERERERKMEREKTGTTTSEVRIKEKVRERIELRSRDGDSDDSN